LVAADSADSLGEAADTIRETVKFDQ